MSYNWLIIAGFFALVAIWIADMLLGAGLTVGQGQPW